MSLAFLAKKSWHTTNLVNVETVWKAEEAKRLEEEKVKEMQMELAQERQVLELKQLQNDAGLTKKGDERLDWMYQGQYKSATSAEDYLCGKKIDDTDEQAAVKEVSYPAAFVVCVEKERPRDWEGPLRFLPLPAWTTSARAHVIMVSFHSVTSSPPPTHT